MSGHSDWEAALTNRTRHVAGVLALTLLAQLLCSFPAFATGDLGATAQPPAHTTAVVLPAAPAPTPATSGIDPSVPASDTTPAAMGLTLAAIDLTPAAIGLTPATIGLTPAAIGLTPTAIGLTPAAVQLPVKPPVDDESVWYRSRNPMKKEHQKILWENARRNRIDYLDMLALVYTESNFNETCVASRRFYGYFQISKGHFADLAYSLQTKNAPLDGAVNIRWGTAMYGWIMESKRVQSLAPEKRLDAALSIYNRGPIGYDRHGLSKAFLARFHQKRAIVETWFAPQQGQP